MKNQELRIAIEALRRPDETNRELVNRIADDERLLSRLVNMCPSLNYNVSMIKRIILSESFASTLN